MVEVFCLELVLGLATVCLIVSWGVRAIEADSGVSIDSEFVRDVALCLAADICHGEAGLGDAGAGSGDSGLLSPCRCVCIILLRSF